MNRYVTAIGLVVIAGVGACRSHPPVAPAPAEDAVGPLEKALVIAEEQVAAGGVVAAEAVAVAEGAYARARALGDTERARRAARIEVQGLLVQGDAAGAARRAADRGTDLEDAELLAAVAVIQTLRDPAGSAEADRALARARAEDAGRAEIEHAGLLVEIGKGWAGEGRAMGLNRTLTETFADAAHCHACRAARALPAAFAARSGGEPMFEPLHVTPPRDAAVPTVERVKEVVNQEINPGLREVQRLVAVLVDPAATADRQTDAEAALGRTGWRLRSAAFRVAIHAMSCPLLDGPALADVTGKLNRLDGQLVAARRREEWRQAATTVLPQLALVARTARADRAVAQRAGR